jgi:hypothetical protein
MIIGNGLLSNGFKNSSFDHKKFVIFASGVSDSKITSDSEFERERTLLLKTITENSDLKLIYFSSVLIDTQNNDYYKHKLKLEKIIQDNSKNYIIFRVPQIVGKNGNKNNLFNFFKYSLLNDKKITIVKNAYRSIIDIQDMVNIVKYCKDIISCDIVTISNIERVEVVDLLNMVSKNLGIIPKYELSYDSNDNSEICNSSIVDKAIDVLKINKNGYTDKIIKKYIN